MTTTVQLATTTRTAALTQLVTELGTTPFLLIYSGTMPATADTAASGSILVALSCSNPVGTVASGVLTLGTVTGANVTTAGTAAYYRLCTDSTGATCLAQGSVDVSGAALNFPNGVTWTVGNPISVTSLTITAPGT